MNLSKNLKKKRDAEYRRNQSRPSNRVVEGTGGSIDIGGSDDYLTQAVTKLNGLHGDIRLTEGDNITLEVVDNEVVISANGGQSGGITDIPQATNTELGGVRANKRTDNEVSEVKIDPISGKLYTTAPDSAINGIPAGGKSGQVLAKIDDVDYNAKWTDVGLKGRPFGRGRIDFYDGQYTQSNGSFNNVFQYMVIKEDFWLEKIEYTVTRDSSMRLIVRDWGGSVLGRTEERVVATNEVVSFTLEEPIHLHRDDYIVIEIITSVKSKTTRVPRHLYDGQLFKVVQFQLDDLIGGSTHHETIALKLIEYQD